MKNPKTEAIRLIKIHIPYAKNWDCWNDAPDERANEVRAAIVTVESVIKALIKKSIHNAGEIIFQRAVLKELKGRLPKEQYNAKQK